LDGFKIIAQILPGGKTIPKSQPASMPTGVALPLRRRRAKCNPYGKKLMRSSVVEFKQTSQALTDANFTRRLTGPVGWPWKQNYIGLPLMVSFVVKGAEIAEPTVVLSYPPSGQYGAGVTFWLTISEG
jgi:hypothetical protein